ncbi:LysM peptidoglycan-binding domain-containing protein [uncultured Porticoccus sp.]|uniref:LysM peptidoglycan-binding domain-containing protein n=1 Tax=uncultured Porticoccus sp. TaxID=1256050 RepID=UPI002635E7B5|nr:LysM peptidoglycan-binding domain-containing protein [uncultured Porticoccus sp.]
MPREKRWIIFSGKNTDKTEPVNPMPSTPDDLWHRVRDGMTLQGHYNDPRIAKQVEWFSNNQSYIDRVMSRSELYLYHIVEALEHNKLPLELTLLPVVESAYDPFAHSGSQASGLWQFIPMTGDRFGLKQDWWYDGRRDPLAATEAAISYLTYLNNYFEGDWLLALAAYNSGEGTVRRAIERNKRDGKPTDFWSLKLPRETRAYVPQLLAISRVVADPASHGIVLPSIPDSPYFEVVDLPEQLDLVKAAEMASIDSGTLHKLNAGYSRWVTHPEGPHRIVLPVESIEGFKLVLNNTPVAQWAPIKEYQVRSGDTLSGIAAKHRVGIRQLRVQNGLQGDLLKIGQRLKIPGTGLDHHPQTVSLVSYRVEAGDTLWRIAREHEVSVQDIATWSQLDINAPLRPGQLLNVKAGSGSATATTKEKKVNYQVRRGDSLYRIASKFDLKIDDILSWNKLNPENYLKPGQQLTLFINPLRI